METLDEKIKSDEVITTQFSFEANETILEGHFKFNRDNERYLYDYLNELYNIFNIGMSGVASISSSICTISSVPSLYFLK